MGKTSDALYKGGLSKFLRSGLRDIYGAFSAACFSAYMSSILFDNRHIHMQVEFSCSFVFFLMQCTVLQVRGCFLVFFLLERLCAMCPCRCLASLQFSHAVQCHNHAVSPCLREVEYRCACIWCAASRVGPALRFVCAGGVLASVSFRWCFAPASRVCLRLSLVFSLLVSPRLLDRVAQFMVSVSFYACVCWCRARDVIGQCEMVAPPPM